MVLVTLLTALLAYKGSQMVAPDGIIVLPGRKEIDESMKIKGLYDLKRDI